MGPAVFGGAADRIPLESLYLAYADEEVVPAAGPACSTALECGLPEYQGQHRGCRFKAERRRFHSRQTV